MDYYKPKYNILHIAGNSFGYKHRVETINKLKENLSEENPPKFGSVTSNETKKAISEGIKNYYLTNLIIFRLLVMLVIIVFSSKTP